MSDKIQQAAQALRASRESRKPIPPVSGSHGILSIQDAYAVADINHRQQLAAGARLVGMKVGLTSKVVQQQLGVDQPDFGLLFDHMEFLNNDVIPMDRLIQPKVEAEIAFVVGRDLAAERISYSEFLSSIEFALPAIEIVDSAIADWKISLADTVADNASSALYVLGDQPVAIGRDSLADLGMTLKKNGHVASIGSGAACLGHPLRAAYWLACTMAERNVPLQRGQVILSGALGPMVPVQSGDVIDVQIASLGNVSCRFSQGDRA